MKKFLFILSCAAALFATQNLFAMSEDAAVEQCTLNAQEEQITTEEMENYMEGCVADLVAVEAQEEASEQPAQD